LIVHVANICGRRNKQRKKAKATFVGLCCLHTYCLALKAS
jgi:hypothetical protein